MSRTVKLTIWAVVLGVLPFLFFLGFTNYQVHNGVVVNYYSLNVIAIGAGLGVLALVVTMLRREPGSGERRPGWVLPVCAVLLVLGTLQVVRGAGVLPSITNCHSESGTLGLCTPTRLDS